MNSKFLFLIALVSCQLAIAQQTDHRGELPGGVSISFPVKPVLSEAVNTKLLQATLTDSSHTFVAICIDQSALYDSADLYQRASQDGFWYEITCDLMKSAKRNDQERIELVTDSVVQGGRRLEFERKLPTGQVDRISVVVFIRKVYLFQFICVARNQSGTTQKSKEFFLSLRVD